MTWRAVAGPAGVFIGLAGLLGALVAAILGTVMLRQESAAPPAPLMFEAGQEVVVPEPPGGGGPLVVYGTDVETGRLPYKNLGCEVRSPSGRERVEFTAATQDDIDTPAGLLAPLAETSRNRAGDVVLCDGPTAAQSGPLALGTGRVVGPSGGLAVLILAGFLFVAGAAFLGVGIAGVASRPRGRS